MSLRLREPDAAALRELYAELGFTSLLKDLAPRSPADDRKTDYAALDSPAALQRISRCDSAGSRDAAVWLSLDSEDPDDEGFGTRVLGVEVSTKPSAAQIGRE